MPLIWVYYYGEVQIAYWEWSLAVFYVVAIYLYFARRKNVMVKKFPEYRFYMWALMIKLFGGVAFSLIYFYYYQGGDTISYFYSGVAMRNMAFTDPMEYIREMLGEHSLANWLAYPSDGVRPYKYVFFDNRTFVVLRVVSILAIISFKSYLISTLIISSLSFFGIWACYRTFVSYYPLIDGKLAIAFLFMPSLIFWSSSILKDTFTFSAVCWLIYAVDEVFFKRRSLVYNSFIMMLSVYMIIAIKPYIFMAFLPAILLWLFYFRISRMKNVLIKFVLIPIIFVVLCTLSMFVLIRMGDQLGKFALDDALTTIQLTHGDLLNSDEYSSNSFDIGEIDGTWIGVISKFPQAVNAALFRPYLWEAKNAVMAISGLENIWILLLTIMAVLRAGPIFFFRCIGKVPLLLMCMIFALLFSFTVGLTTPNFGALVRFRIPMMPFFIGSLFIIVHLAKLKNKREKMGLDMDISQYVERRNVIGGRT